MSDQDYKAGEKGLPWSPTMNEWGQSRINWDAVNN
jgi:hypothetical protein